MCEDGESYLRIGLAARRRDADYDGRVPDALRGQKPIRSDGRVDGTTIEIGENLGGMDTIAFKKDEIFPPGHTKTTKRKKGSIFAILRETKKQLLVFSTRSFLIEQASENTKQTKITEQTKHFPDPFRLFRYFRLFRILLLLIWLRLRPRSAASCDFVDAPFSCNRLF